jgi:hypothetical protein
LPWLGYAEPPYWGRISSLTILRRQAGGIMRHASTIHYIHRLYKTARQIDTTPKNSLRARSHHDLSAPVINHVAHVSRSFLSCASSHHVFYTCFLPKAAVSHVTEVLQPSGHPRWNQNTTTPREVSLAPISTVVVAASIKGAKQPGLSAHISAFALVNH